MCSELGERALGLWLQRCPEGALRSLELQILGSESGSMGEVRMLRCCAACLLGPEGIALGSCGVKLADVIGKEKQDVLATLKSRLPHSTTVKAGPPRSSSEITLFPEVNSA